MFGLNLKHQLKNKWRAWLIGLLLISNLVTWLVIWFEDRGEILRVSFLGIGQGDAIFISAPNGNQVLVDGGPGRQILRRLAEVMPFYDRSIDLVVETHPDSDHISGLLDVFDRYQVSGFMEPGILSTNQVDDALKVKVKASGAKTILAREGQRVVLDRGRRIYLDILYPDDFGITLAGDDTNMASIVARLTYGSSSFMLTGDAPIKVERRLLATESSAWSSTVLKAGHHGSRTSSLPEFVAVVNPEFVVISAGQNNRYGHPHPEVVKILEEAKIKILSTIERGTINFATNGQTLTVE